MAEFAVSKSARLFALAMLLVPNMCHMASAQEYEPWGEEAIDWSEWDTVSDSYVRPPHPELRGTAPDYSIRIENREPEYYADVVIQNQLVQAVYTADTVHFHRPDGLVITVIADQKDGSAPDYFYVIPPPGHCAVPADVILQEQEMAVIQIHPCTIG